MKRPELLLLFIFLASCSSSKTDLISQISFFKDYTDTVTIDQAHDINYHKLTDTKLGFNDAVFWFRIDLNQENLKDEEVFLEIDETYLKHISLFNSHNELLYSNSASIVTSNYSIHLEHPTPVIYAKVVFAKQSYININAYSKSQFESNKMYSLVQKGGFYVLVLLIFVINLLLAYFFRHTIFLWYLFFQLNVSIGIALYDNTLANFVGPDQVSYLLGLNYLLTPISCALFCVKFLRVKEFYPKMVLVYKILAVLITGIVTVFFITKDFKMLSYSEAFSTFIYLSTWVLGFLLLKKVPYAKYYVLGYSVLVITGVLYSLSVTYGIHFFPFTINFLKAGVLVEILIFTFALMQKAQTVLQENEEMRMQLNDFVKQLKENQPKEEHKDLPSLFEDKLFAISDKYGLTERETDVLLQISNGLSNPQIAEKLYVSVNTVKYHTRNLYEKLDISKRTEITPKLFE